MKTLINVFKGRYNFLSNFYFSSFVLGGMKYPTVEHYYQSQKAASNKDRRWILDAEFPSQAKKRGRRIKLIDVWEEAKDLVMETGVRAKFQQNKKLLDKLILTYDAELVEGNYWHDNYWGDCWCEGCSSIEGLNMLGKILMKIRKESINEDRSIRSNRKL